MVNPETRSPQTSCSRSTLVGVFYFTNQDVLDRECNRRIDHLLSESHGCLNTGAQEAAQEGVCVCVFVSHTYIYIYIHTNNDNTNNDNNDNNTNDNNDDDNNTNDNNDNDNANETDNDKQ